MSVEAIAWVWKHSPYRDGTLVVHLAIADVVNDTYHNEFWMQRPDLAKKAHTSVPTVARALRQMVDAGLLEVLERGGGRGRGTRYRFLMPADAPLWTSDETGSDCDGLQEAKPDHLSTETGSSARRIGITQENSRTQASASKSVVDNPGDPECTSCRGSGVVYSATAGTDAPCRCVGDPHYEPAPAKATRPIVGFGMPARRGDQ